MSLDYLHPAGQGQPRGAAFKSWPAPCGP